MRIDLEELRGKLASWGSPCEHRVPNAGGSVESQLHGVCIFCWRDRGAALAMAIPGLVAEIRQIRDFGSDDPAVIARLERLDDAGASSGPRARIEAALPRLNLDELEVAALIAERLVAGQKVYGPLDLATDQRDFRREGHEEAVDAAIYLACETLKRRGT
jgi:hypothetical protein